MASKRVIKELNKMLNTELYSSYLCVAMASYCSFMGLKGSSGWFFCQAREELTHVQRVFLYLTQLGSHASMASIDQPPGQYTSLQHIFEEWLTQEKDVSSKIKHLTTLAGREQDPATEVFLQWFVKRQLEIEDRAKELISKLKMAGKSGSALFMIDNELSSRTFVVPEDLSGSL
jgi:ferritin